MIRILILCLAIAVITAESSPGQEFWFGGSENDYARAITRTSDGCYVVAGRTLSHGGDEYGAYVLKLDQTGSIVWEHRHSDVFSENLYDVIPTEQGGCVVAGYKAEPGGRLNTLLAELDEDGHPEWVKVHDRNGENEEIHTITHANGGGYIIAGHAVPLGIRGVWGPVAAKLNEVGKIEWVWIVEQGWWDELETVIPASDGGYVAAGNMLFEELEYRALAIKLTEDGTIEWMKTYDLGYSGHAYGICYSTHGGYILSGNRFEDDVDPDGDAFLLRIDNEGNELWREYYGGEKQDMARSVIRARGGGYLFAGYTQIPLGTELTNYQRQAWAVRVDENGAIEEEWLFGGSDNDEAYDVVRAWGGGYVLAGWTTSYGAGGKDVYVVMFGDHYSR